ncbi:MAG: hypothetical protein ACFFE8_06465 [Candidatus Heimdallarchaeota archaeon]
MGIWAFTSHFHSIRNTTLILFVIFSIIPIVINMDINTGVDGGDFDKFAIPLLETPSTSRTNPRPSSSPVFQVSNQSASDADPIPFDMFQVSQFPLHTNQTRRIKSPPNTNISIESEISNSTYKINSNAEDQSQDWANGYGPIVTSMIPTLNGTAFRANFTDNNQSSAGIQNVKFNMSTVPPPSNFPTFISFDYRMPFVNQNLQDSPPTLSLEFEFVNSTSITFYLSKGGNLPGDPVNETISRPIGTDPSLLLRNASSSLYILYNGSLPSSWRHISINISWMINTCFSKSEYPLFSELKAVKLTLFLFTLITPQFTLDIDNLEYYTENLPLNGSLSYFIDSTEIFSANGSVAISPISGNFTFFVKDNSPWNRSSEIYLNVTITRVQTHSAFSTASNWNSTHVKIFLRMFIPNISENLIRNEILIFLPTDWADLRILNASTQLYGINVTKSLNMYLLGKQYWVESKYLDPVVLEALAPNYLVKIIAPTDLNTDDILRVKGDLTFPLAGDLHLYLLNNACVYDRSTLPMINGSFSFPDIPITEVFPIGLLRLEVNWSSNWEFGFYEQDIVIHEPNESAMILLHTQQNVTIYQYEPLFINLSLFLGNVKYIANSTLVLLTKGNISLFFSHTPRNDFALNITNVIWSPGNISIFILASDSGNFFAKKQINLKILSSLVVWSFENLNTGIYINDSVLFRLYSYLQPPEGGTLQILQGLTVKIWVNNSMVFQKQTNSAGYADIDFRVNPSIIEGQLYVGIGGFLEESLVKFQTIIFTILNGTLSANETRADIYELSRSPIGSNGTFFVYYAIEYSTNDSSWYTPLPSYGLSMKAAFILRNYYVVGVNFRNGVLSWNLNGNVSSTDILVIELPSPTVYISQLEFSEKFRIKISLDSVITVNNFTTSLDLSFLGFIPLNLSLLDTLGRDITSATSINIEGTQVTISRLNIVGGLPINYFLEGYLADLNVNALRSFQRSYFYNETIKGSWLFYSPLNFSYSVIYSVGHYSLICFNTSYKTFSNGSTRLEAQLSPQSWNSTVSIILEVRYSSTFIAKSREQSFTITDPYMPVLEYSIETSDEFIRIHTFVFEPEQGSGVRNVSVMDTTRIIVSNNFTMNYHVFNVPMTSFVSKNIYLKAMDWAGNINTVNITKILIEHLVSNPSSLLTDLEYLAPTIISILILGGLFLMNFIKRRRMSILQT